jgi:hypothetical protein
VGEVLDVFVRSDRMDLVSFGLQDISDAHGSFPSRLEGPPVATEKRASDEACGMRIVAAG